MAIATTCPSCKSLFRLPEEFAGKEVRCQRCEQMFAVPGSPPSAPAAAPILATVVEPPKKEVVQATRVEPPAAARPPKPPPPLRPPSVLVSLIAVAMFLLLMVATGGVAAVYVFANLSAPTKLVAPPPTVRNVEKPVKDWIGAEQKDKGGDPFAFGAKLTIDAPGRTDDNLLNGPRSYHVVLKANQRYNFILDGTGFAPRLQLFDDLGVVAEKEDDRRAMLSYLAPRDGSYTLKVSPRPPQFNGGNFTLEYAPVQNVQPTRINLANFPTYTANQTLRIEDAISPDTRGPAKVYTMPVVDRGQYRFRITQSPPGLVPALVLKEGNQVVDREDGDPITRNLDFTYESDFTGELTILVFGDRAALGNYTLTVTRLGKAK